MYWKIWVIIYYFVRSFLFNLSLFLLFSIFPFLGLKWSLHISSAGDSNQVSFMNHMCSASELFTIPNCVFIIASDLHYSVVSIMLTVWVAISECHIWTLLGAFHDTISSHLSPVVDMSNMYGQCPLFLYMYCIPCAPGYTCCFRFSIEGGIRHVSLYPASRPLRIFLVVQVSFWCHILKRKSFFWYCMWFLSTASKFSQFCCSENVSSAWFLKNISTECTMTWS